MTLGELIKSKGFTQRFIKTKLVEAGVNVSEPHLSKWCRGEFKPRLRIVITQIAKIINATEEEVESCFKNE